MITTAVSALSNFNEGVDSADAAPPGLFLLVSAARFCETNSAAAADALAAVRKRRREVLRGSLVSMSPS